MSKRRALIAEDSFLILCGLEMLLETHSIEIVGPASTVEEAMTLAETGGADIAILDVNLHGEMIFPVADWLIERGTPVILLTGYVPEFTLPPRFKEVPTLQKPCDNKVLIGLIEQAFIAAKEVKKQPYPINAGV